MANNNVTVDRYEVDMTRVHERIDELEHRAHRPPCSWVSSVKWYLGITACIIMICIAVSSTAYVTARDTKELLAGQQTNIGWIVKTLEKWDEKFDKQFEQIDHRLDYRRRSYDKLKGK